MIANYYALVTEIDTWVGEIHLVSNDKFFLVTEKAYSDFIFEGEVMLPEGRSNSGFMFRCHVEPKFHVNGMQFKGIGRTFFTTEYI